MLPGATPFCQLGCGSKVLELPPPLVHTAALFQVVVEAFRVVPPTATTYCDAAGQLGVTPPSPHSSAPESPVEMEKVCPCATACWKIWSCAAAEPSPCALVSHSPSDTLMILVALALTMVLKSAVRLALDRVGML